MNPIIDVFRTLAPLSIETVEKLERIMKHDVFPRNTDLLKIGERAKSIYYLKTGLARTYYFYDEKEVTDYLAMDGHFIGAVPSLINGQPSKKGIHLLEVSDVYHFLSTDFEKICAEHHDLEHLARIMVTIGMLEEQEMVESLRFYSMKQRYELLEQKYHGIMNRCPLHYIASYLGTSQVTVSRIRSGIQ